MTSKTPGDGHGEASVPILLLKTASSPTDAYRDLLSTSSFSPRFVPVLSHRPEEPGQSTFRTVLQNRRVSHHPDSSYGGLIFTSQRAVEIFAKLVEEEHDSQEINTPSWPHLHNVPIYSVGPATTRALEAIPQAPTPLRIFGSHTGNGEALAHFILDHYAEWYPGRRPLPPLLFPVGEQRRDIIPRTLSGDGTPPERRIHVDEEVVYGTGVMESFPEDFDQALSDTESAPSRWVVVFSPTGCESMLRGLGLLDPETGMAQKVPGRKTFVAVIGPTTQSHLRSTFGFEPDVCAETPSPEGVLQGIRAFTSN